MKRLAQMLVLSIAMMSAAVASATTRQLLKGSKLTGELKKDLTRRVDKPYSVWTTNIGGKPGDLMRPFTASSVREITIPGNAPQGALGGVRVHIGWMISGKISTKTGRTYIQGRAQPRSAPTPAAQQ